MLYLAGIIITFFLVAILVGKKNKSDADWILAAWLFFTGLHLVSFYAFITGKFFQYPQLLGFEIPFPLLHGPFLYLYTSSLTNQYWRRNLRMLHFLPFVLAYVPLLPFLFSDAAHKIETYNQQGQGYEWIMVPLNAAWIVSGIAYVLLSLKKLYRHRKNIDDQFSNTDKINLVWLRYLIIGLSGIWLLVIYGRDDFTYTAAVAYVFFIGYFGIKQTGIFSHNMPAPVQLSNPAAGETTVDEPEIAPFAETDSNTEKGKYLKSGLNEDELLQIHNRLTSLMEQERLYTNPELTLSDTAQQLNVHPNYLSQVINSITKKNFYDYINFQRVEEFTRLVLQPQNQKFTLLSLAFECGFNSKTSFNRNFRKVTGLSPSEYLKQIHVNLNPEM